MSCSYVTKERERKEGGRGGGDHHSCKNGRKEGAVKKDVKSQPLLKRIGDTEHKGDK